MERRDHRPQYIGIRVNTRDKIFCHVNPSSSGGYVGYVRARAFSRARNYRPSWRKRLYGCSAMIRVPVTKDISGKLFRSPSSSISDAVGCRAVVVSLSVGFYRDKKKKKKLEHYRLNDFDLSVR